MGVVPGRECGGCGMCCISLLVNSAELKKLAGVRCTNCAPDGNCAIHAIRPKVCRAFECGWRMTPELGDDWRPDRSGIILTAKVRGNPPGYRADSGVQITLLKPSALYKKELPGLIAAWVKARVPLFLTVPAPVGYMARTAFLNESLQAIVAREDRGGLLALLERLVGALSRRKLQPVDFSAIPMWPA